MEGDLEGRDLRHRGTVWDAFGSPGKRRPEPMGSSHAGDTEFGGRGRETGSRQDRGLIGIGSGVFGGELWGGSKRGHRVWSTEKESLAQGQT